MMKDIEEKIKTEMPKLAELFMGVALGEKVFSGGKAQEAAATRVWDTLSPVIKRLSESRAVEANSASDIIAMLKSGSIGIQDAKDLMAIMSSKSEMDEIANLQKQIDSLVGADKLGDV